MTIKKTLNNEHSLHLSQIQDFEEEFASSTLNKVAMHAMCHGDAQKVGLNRQTANNLPMTFSTEIAAGDITDQKMSGRCWMFAGLNLLRIKAMKKMNLKSFELSQSYIMFYDKLERSNYFLENILKTLDEEKNSRLIMWLLNNPLEDGGQWDMFVNLVEKYGAVPKELYPESVSSSSTRVMNSHLNEKLREFACQLRVKYEAGQSIEQLRALKSDMLSTIYRILTIHNGVPPKKFNWSYKDKDDKFCGSSKEVSPQEFFKKYVDIDLNDYVSLLSCPTKDKPFSKHYTVSHLGNLVEGRKISYINVGMDVMKKAALASLKDGEPVWFGCDVGKQLATDSGIIDIDSFAFEDFYSTSFAMDKAARVDYGHSQMTHAMLFTGVHEQNKKTMRWKVENSWGDKKGKKGFLVMGDAWFDEYVFQIAVHKKLVDKELLKELDKSPTILAPWDPMGSLA
jgi:bleomycin hydrolase